MIRGRGLRASPHHRKLRPAFHLLIHAQESIVS